MVQHGRSEECVSSSSGPATRFAPPPRPPATRPARAEGVYQYKLTSSGSGWTAKPFGEMADGLPECTGGEPPPSACATGVACHHRVPLLRSLVTALSLSLSLTTRLSLDVAATAEEVEKAMYDACKEASGTEKEFTFANDMVSPKVSLFTAAIEAAYEPK